MRKYLDKKYLRPLILAAVLLLLAAGVEFLFVARSQSDLTYAREELSGGEFAAVELRAMDGNMFYVLSYDSYLEIGNLGGVPVQSIDILLTRHPSDQTQSVLRYVGTTGGIYGEFPVGMTMTDENHFTATINCDALESLKIFPTEHLHSEFTFEGIILNPTVETPAFSLPRVILWGFLLASLYVMYRLIAAKAFKKGTPVGRWASLYILVTALVLAAAFQGTRLFSGMRALGEMVMVAAFAAVTALFALLWFFVKRARRPETKLLMAVLVVGLLFVFANAPLQAPDEYLHYMRAYAISRGHFAFNDDEEFPDDVYHLVAVFPSEYYNEIQLPGKGSVPGDIVRYLSLADTPFTGSRAKTAAQVVLPYLPSALGIAAARLLGLNALFCLYAGRVANLLVFALCSYYSLKHARRWRGGLILLSLVPLTIFMAASTSYDSMFLSCVVLFFGLLARESLTRRDLLLLCAAFAMFVAIKPIYFPLALMVLCVPKESVRTRMKRPLILLALLVAGGVLYALTLVYAGMFNYGIQPLESLPGVQVSAQIRYVLQNPLRYIIILLVDSYTHAFYLTDFGIFGWLDVPAVLTGLLTPILFVFAGALYADSARKMNKGEVLIPAAVIVLTYTVVVTGFYCAWSSLGSSSILGVQARYLLPLLPCLIPLLSRAFAPVFRYRSALSERDVLRDNLCVYAASAVAMLGALELAMRYFLM